MTLTQPQAEALRHAVREFLAVRFPTAHPPRAIRRTVANEVDFSVGEEDVITAAEFLLGLGQARKESDPLGSTVYYCATAAGVLAQERRE